MAIGHGRCSDDVPVVLLGLLVDLLPLRHPVHRRPDQLRLQRRPCAALRRLREDPRPPLRRVPGDVLGYHGDHRHRRCRRAREDAAMRHIHVRLGDSRIRPDRLLDLEPPRVVE